MPALHPVTFWILIAIGALLAVTPLLFVILDKLGRLSAGLRVDLWTRYRSWLALAPLMVLPAAFGGHVAILAVAVLGALCFREFARATGLFRQRLVSGVVALGGVLITFAIADHWYNFFTALTSLVVSAIVIFSLFEDNPSGYIQRVALGVLAYMLFGVSLGHFSYFANDPLGPPIQLSILLGVSLNDVFAYGCGKTFGRRKLAPKTSPNKTLGGALGALALTTGLFAALASFIFAGTVLAQPKHLLAMGALVSLTGMWGDLVMSSVKRDLGIKDLAATIPGHGGLLDRFDSLLFVGPALFHYIGYFRGVGLDQPARIFSGG